MRTDAGVTGDVPKPVARHVLDTLRDAVVITDRSGDIVYVNPAFTRLTGYPADEVIGNNPRILRSGQQDDSLYADLWQTVLSGEPWHGEIVNRRRDGTLYADDMSIIPYVEDGVVTHMIATKRDVDRVLGDVARLSPVGIAHLTGDGRLLYANPTFQDLLAHAYVALVGHGWLDALTLDDRLTAVDLVTSPHRDRVVTLALPDDRVGSLRAADLGADEDRPFGVVVSLVDTTEEVRARDLALSRERFAHAIIDGLHDPTVVVTDEGQLVRSNAAWQTFVAQIGGDEGAERLHDLWPARSGDFDDVRVLLDSSQALDRVAVGEIRTAGTDGTRWWLVRCAPLEAVSGRILTWTDITRRKQEELRLVERADHDPLTGLANRYATMRWLDDQLQQGSVGVLFLDLDGFKTINDTLGHRAGDEMLLTVTRRLLAAARSTDLVARLGGDEFLVLVPGVEDDDALQVVVERVREVVEQPAVLTEGRASVGVSIGVEVARPGADATEVIGTADERMYEEKRRRSSD